MVTATKHISATDLSDKTQLEIVRTNRIALKNARVKIEKRGKELREDALKFQKAVIAKEKELVAIIEPEEDRLAAIEEEAKAIVIRQQRTEQLAARRERLASIGDNLPIDDDHLLTVDDIQFDAYFNQRTADKQAADAAKLAEERRKLDEEKLAIEREKETRQREEIARREERERADADAARKEQERIEREAREKAETERRDRQEKERLEKEASYRAFRESHGWTPTTQSDFKEERVNGEIILWKKLGAFKIN
jgi:hypothetical protein